VGSSQYPTGDMVPTFFGTLPICCLQPENNFSGQSPPLHKKDAKVLTSNCQVWIRCALARAPNPRDRGTMAPAGAESPWTLDLN